MRIDFKPVPHQCNLPDPAQFKLNTLITCDDVRGQRFNGRSYSEVRCERQWRRGVTMWRRRPTWVEVDVGW